MFLSQLYYTFLAVVVNCAILGSSHVAHFFVTVEDRVKVYQGIERKPKSTPGILVNYCLQISHVSNLK